MSSIFQIVSCRGRICDEAPDTRVSVSDCSGSWTESGEIVLRRCRDLIGCLRFVFIVCSHVTCPLIAARESSPASVASERFFSGVRTKMGGEMIAATEASEADAAVEGSMTGVDPDVPGQLVAAGEPPVAGLGRARVGPVLDGHPTRSGRILPRLHRHQFHGRIHGKIFRYDRRRAAPTPLRHRRLHVVGLVDWLGLHDDHFEVVANPRLLRQAGGQRQITVSGWLAVVEHSLLIDAGRATEGGWRHGCRLLPILNALTVTGRRWLHERTPTGLWRHCRIVRRRHQRIIEWRHKQTIILWSV